MQRVMPTSFFLLMRFFLRVDGVLIRINDTRLYHEARRCEGDDSSAAGVHPLQSVMVFAFVFQAGKDYLLREFSTRENKIAELKVRNDKLLCEKIYIYTV